MRLWSINPGYLDSKGLVALWREGLLAQKVLLGETKGYKNHPQLDRFKEQNDPVASIGRYLHAVYLEAKNRGYNFDKSKIVSIEFVKDIPVTAGQAEYEYWHLVSKIEKRDPKWYEDLNVKYIRFLHPMFCEIEGDVEPWEKIR